MVYSLFLLSCQPQQEAPKEYSQPNFVVIDIDSLRWERMASNDAPSSIAPNMQNLAYDSVFLNSVYAPASWTFPSLTGLLTGQPPPISDYDGNQVSWIPETQRSLPEILRYYGYTTTVFWGETLPAKEKRFSSIFNKDCSNCIEKGFDAPIQWLKSNDAKKPFFLFVHNIDLHHYTTSIPFEELHRTTEAVSGCHQRDIPNVAQQLNTQLPKAEAEAHVIAHYDGMLHYYDKQLARLFETIQDLPDADNTVVIILSNHGEALFENELLGHARIHHESVLRTGLIWHDPQITRKGQSHTTLSLLDVAPSILERAGIPIDRQMTGRSFLPLLKGEDWIEKPVYATTDLHAASIIDGSDKLSMQYLPCPKPESRSYQAPLKHKTCTILINRQLDPEELNDLSLTEPARTEELQGQLVAWLNKRVLSSTEVSNTPADEALKSALKERGYWGDAQTVEAESKKEVLQDSPQ